jgi:hypothetical protein
MKSMSDGDVNDFVFKKLTDDLDDIEGKSMFDEAPQDAMPEGVKIEANGMSVHVKPMNGEQVQDMPKMMKDDDEEEDMKLGL